MKTLTANNLILATNEPVTFLTADVAAGTTLTVKNIAGFAINQTLLIGEFGNDSSEIVKTHTATAPTGSTITLVAASLFPHSSGTPVRVILYDQVDFANATTLTGSKTSLSIVNIDATSNDTQYNDTLASTGYYFTRFKNSITSSVSSYSDPLPVGGYGIYTARSIIDNALAQIGKVTSPLLNDQYCFSQLNNGQIEVLRELKRWSFMQVFNYSLGELRTGTWKIAAPTNLDDQNTNKTIWNFKIGTSTNLTWVDKEKWNEIIQGVSNTTLASNIAVGATTVTLTDSSDFQDSGTIYVGANTYSYSANDRDTNVLTITTSTTTNTSGEVVFSGGTLGTPIYCTIFDGYIYYYPILDSESDHKNAYLDYYKKMTVIENDTDEIVLPDPTVMQYYLSWKLLLRISAGTETEGSMGFYNKYVMRREKLKQKDALGRSFQLKPLLNRRSLQNDSDDEATRLGNFDTGF